MTDELEKNIGTKDKKVLVAGSVLVKDVKVELAKEGSKAKIVRFLCKHPDSVDLIRLSNVKIKSVQGNNETIKKDTTWWNVDDDDNIRKGSVLANVLTFYNKQTLKDFIGTEIKTEADAAGYLCIKAY